jgi:hypothetical protein
MPKEGPVQEGGRQLAERQVQLEPAGLLAGPLHQAGPLRQLLPRRRRLPAAAGCLSANIFFFFYNFKSECEVRLIYPYSHSQPVVLEV